MTDTLIALETSGTRCGVALWRRAGAGSPVLVCDAHEGVQEHAARLLPMVSRQLESVGSTPADVDVIAFGQGPGAFTGLRVACGVAQGMGLALGVPVVAVGSHCAVADMIDRLPEPQLVAVAMDARMAEVYVTVMVLAGQVDPAQWDGPAPRVLIGPVLMAATDLPTWLAQGLGGWKAEASGAGQAWLAGDAWAAYGSDLAWPTGWTAHAAQAPSAAAVARLGALAWRAGLGADPADVHPLYVRDKVAFTTAERAAGSGGNPKAAPVAGEAGQ